jgi:hypothetical protein
MERDERDQATDGQADATPPVAGYVPSKDVVREIVQAASEVRAVLDRWQRHSALSEYPQDDVIGLAMDALFRLERAVNPRRQRWRARLAAPLNFHVWPPWVRVGLRWSRDLTATILERHELQWMADATREDFLLRRADPSSRLETISITGEELRAFDAILEYLPGLDSLPEPPEHPVKVAATAPTPEPEPEAPTLGWIRLSKRDLNQVLEASPCHKTRIKEAVDSGEIEFRKAHFPMGHWNYEAKWKTAEGERKAREKIAEIRNQRRQPTSPRTGIRLSNSE